MIAMYNLW